MVQLLFLLADFKGKGKKVLIKSNQKFGKTKTFYLNGVTYKENLVVGMYAVVTLLILAYVQVRMIVTKLASKTYTEN